MKRIEPLIKKIKMAAADADAAVKSVALKVDGVKLADGSLLAADGQLATTLSVLFDAVTVIVFDEGAKTRQWSREKSIGILA